MRIGVLSLLDVSILKPFVDSLTEQRIIEKIACKTQSPSVDTLVLSLLKKGCFLRIFTIGKVDYIYKSSSFELFVIKANSIYIVRNTWDVFDKARRLKNVLMQNYSDLDVLHAHWTYEYVYAAKSLSSEIPIVCTVRDWAPYIWKMVTLKNKPLWTFKFIMAKRVFTNKKINFVANSPYTFNLLKEIGIQAPIIPNSILDSFFEDVVPHNLNHLNLLCISSSDDSRKNVITLLKAFKLIREKYPSAVLKLVGGCFTPDSPNCINYKSQGLLQNVDLCGFVDHDGLKVYLDQASIFVTPSLEETFGNTLLESISRKVPTLGGKDSGAVPYVLHHGKVGYLCDVTDAKSIASAIDYIYTHKEEAINKAEYAYTFIKNEYSESFVADKYIEIYTSCVNQ